ncbi:MAG: hypothetical protein QOH86_1608 [Sphingomonadales bacterium]|jgi:hypothetical protein|nr:hypothetical protein [Sphingomonadales bacterium]
MADLVAELNSLDFSVYIGGPMQAAIQAQTAASMATVNFIKEVGFEPGTAGAPDKIRYVAFKFTKLVPNPNFNSAQPVSATNQDMISQDVEVSVPFIAMLTMPALRIDELTIDFNAKLTSVETSSVNSEFAASAELGINYKVINFKASASYKRTSSRGTSVEKTYNLGVKVTAVNDEIPEGLDRILTMLEDSIVSKAA